MQLQVTQLHNSVIRRLATADNNRRTKSCLFCRQKLATVTTFVILHAHRYFQKNLLLGLGSITTQTCTVLRSLLSKEQLRQWKGTVMHRITTFRSTTDRIYDGGPMIL